VENHALECRGLAKRFGPVPAVQDLDLTVAKGQIVALLGPSGCGKTTTLRLIAGFDRPDAGSMCISGRVASNAQGAFLPPEARRVGMVFQEGALFPHLTVAQNVAYGLPQAHGRQERVQQVLELVGLSALEHRRPHQLSGGQQQRVALARALAPAPELLLLDEPFSNLDPSLRQQVRHDVREILRATNSTAIFVTHDQEEALSMGDVVGVMNLGRIEQLAPPEEIFHHPATRFVAQFIGMVDFIPGSLEGGQLTTEVGSVPWPGNAPASGPVDVMVRPDCLDCVAATEGRGVVTHREFRGAFYLYQVAFPSGSTVRCLLSHTEDLPIGAPVSVTLRHGHDLRPFAGGAALVR
jgi:iron(III) transport system ATP-binding protein